MAVLLTPPALQFFDDNGDPLSGGKVYTYSAGTTTAKATYTDSGGLTAHANPVVLDSAGRPPGGSIWLLGSYKFVVTDADDVTVTTTDNVSAFTVTGDSSDPYFESFSGDGSTVEFTLSEDLGTDERAIFVFVNDEAGDVGFNIQPPTAYSIDGTTLTFVTAPPTGTNSVQVWAPSLLVAAAAASAATAVAAADSAAADANLAAISEAAAAASAVAAAASAALASAIASTDALLIANDLSDLNDAPTARSNLGVSYATSGEIDTGSAATKIISPDALNASRYGLVEIASFEFTSDTEPTAADGQATITVKSQYNGMDVVAADAEFTGTVATGANTTIDIYNVTDTVDIFSSPLTVTAGTRYSNTVTIDTDNDDLATGDELRLDINQIGSTLAGTGLVVKLYGRMP